MASEFLKGFVNSLLREKVVPEQEDIFLFHLEREYKSAKTYLSGALRIVLKYNQSVIFNGKIQISNGDGGSSQKETRDIVVSINKKLQIASSYLEAGLSEIRSYEQTGNQRSRTNGLIKAGKGFGVVVAIIDILLILSDTNKEYYQKCALHPMDEGFLFTSFKRTRQSIDRSLGSHANLQILYQFIMDQAEKRPIRADAGIGKLILEMSDLFR